MSSLERLATERTTADPAPPAASLRGRRYGEDRLHLLVRDPHAVFTTWEISPALASLASSRAAAAGAPLRYRLLIECRERPDAETRIAAGADLPDALGQESWYFNLRAPGREARALLGLDLAGAFEPLLASRWMPVPPDGPCDEEGPWDLDPEGAAWLSRHAGGARNEMRPVPNSASRYLVSPRTKR